MMVFDFMKKKRSVIYNWVLSYLLLILIPIIVTGFVYNVAKNIIEEEINGSNQLMIGKIRDNIDNILRDVERFSLEVASNPSIGDILELSRIEDASYYSIYKAAKELGNYKIYNSTLKHFYIYFKNLKTIVAPGTMHDQAIYFNGFLASKNYTLEQWLETMGKSYRGDYLVMPYHEEALGDAKTIGYIRSLPITVLRNFAANLVVLLDFHDLVPGSGNKKGNQTSLLIMDKNGKILIGETTDHGFTGLDYGQMEDDQGSMSKKLGGKTFIISYTTSKVNKWKYITVTPESVFWQKAQFIRNIMLVGLIVCMVLGGFLSYLFLRSNYNPLKEMVTQFRSQLRSETDWESDEYGFIRQAFNKTLEQNETIRLKLEQQNRALKSKFLADLLKGRDMAAPVHELMTTFNVSFKYSHFTVMVIYIEHMDEDFLKKDYGMNVDKYHMSKLIITKVVEELVNRNLCGYMTEVDDMLTCLINMNPEGEDNQAALIATLKEAKSFMEDNYRISLVFAVGALHESLESVPLAFIEAVNTMEYSRVMGLDNLAFHRDIPQENGSRYYYPFEKEYQLANCIKSADFEAASGILEEVFAKNFMNGTPSLEITKCLMIDLTSTMLKIANEIEKADDRGFIEKLNPAGELLECRTFIEMKSKMLRVMKTICEYIARSNEQTDYTIRDSVIELVTNNYNDPNLGIASIAERIGKSPYYVSKIFKDQTEEGILEYINRVRIIKAKELLKESRLNQEEIAEKVGYTNVRTFQRAFKKLEGVSPGKLKG